MKKKQYECRDCHAGMLYCLPQEDNNNKYGARLGLKQHCQGSSLLTMEKKKATFARPIRATEAHLAHLAKMC